MRKRGVGDLPLVVSWNQTGTKELMIKHLGILQAVDFTLVA